MRKIRPALIVSNNASNKALSRVQVVPLSSKVAKTYPSEALVTLRAKPSKAMADQLATVGKLRLRSRIERLSPPDVEAVKASHPSSVGSTINLPAG